MNFCSIVVGFVYIMDVDFGEERIMYFFLFVVELFSKIFIMGILIWYKI